MPLSRMEQLLAFLDWERKNSPPTDKQHVVEWAYEELVRLKSQVEPVRDAAYDKVDRFLRNNLDDPEYTEYSEALDRVYVYTSTPPRITAAQVEQIKLLAEEVESSMRSVVEAEYATMGDPSLKYKRRRLEEDRAALHAALDSLVKGE